MKGGGILAGICALDVALMVIAAVLYLGQDRTAPVISYGSDSLTYEEGMDESLLLAGVTAQDERDGDVTGSLMVEKISETSNGNVIITYVAKDHSDNVGKASRTVRAVQGGQDLSDGTEADLSGENAGGNAEPGTAVQETEGMAGEPETGPEIGTGDGTSPAEGQDTGTPDGEEPVGGEENQEANQQPLEGDNGNVQDQPEGNVQPEQGEARPEGQPQGEEQQPGDGQAQDGQGQGIPEGNDIDGNGVEANQPPILNLRTSSLSVQAGSQSVDWNQCIGNLSDDRDSQAQLFSNLVMEGFVDLNTPGEYPVMLYTRDSEGLESARQVVTVRVEG